MLRQSSGVMPIGRLVLDGRRMRPVGPLFVYGCVANWQEAIDELLVVRWST